MQAYFSHSYRDVPINTYFSELFDAAKISLRADQKSEVWCMAKLERYMFEMGGFVSIIPRRIAADESITYSPYIGRELMLARRARAPRILFVDDQVLNSHRSDFPATAVPFFHDAPETERARHVEVIDQFRKDLAGGLARPPRRYVEKRATVIAGKEPLLRDAASHVAAILRSKTYISTVKNAAGLDQAFDDIDVFESLLDSELCVFVLDKELSHSDLLLAMAHAHCIPSVRLRHDPEATSSDPELSGVVRWKSAEELRPRFLKVFENYLSAFQEPSSKEDLQRLATPSAGGSEWDPSDGPGLLAHIQPEDSYVSDRVDGVMRGLASLEKSRLHSDRVCRSLYDRIKKERFYYTYEPASAQKAAQRIRTPTEIGALNCGTCIDYVCMFASMLEAAHEEPVVVVTRTGGRAHAVAGYYAPDAIAWDSPPQLGDLRGAINSGDVVLFETTGAVEARGGTVAAETESERKEGGSMLDYQTAKDAAKRLIGQNDVEVTHFIDVKQARLNRA
ncbi:MAG: hypothetical protein EWM73_03054 [Nitrospira sp.]|nr:MAG: hypothetical protein EWM73_03054 [Nitrospira sp.]